MGRAPAFADEFGSVPKQGGDMSFVLAGFYFRTCFIHVLRYFAE
jgi:hypothetical protein